MLMYEDTDGVHVVSKKEAIGIAVSVAKAEDFTYDNEEQALEDFKVIHWAHDLAVSAPFKILKPIRNKLIDWLRAHRKKAVISCPEDCVCWKVSTWIGEKDAILSKEQLDKGSAESPDNPN